MPKRTKISPLGDLRVGGLLVDALNDVAIVFVMFSPEIPLSFAAQAFSARVKIFVLRFRHVHEIRRESWSLLSKWGLVHNDNVSSSFRLSPLWSYSSITRDGCCRTGSTAWRLASLNASLVFIELNWRFDLLAWNSGSRPLCHTRRHYAKSTAPDRLALWLLLLTVISRNSSTLGTSAMSNRNLCLEQRRIWSAKKFDILFQYGRCCPITEHRVNDSVGRISAI